MLLSTNKSALSPVDDGLHGSPVALADCCVQHPVEAVIEVSETRSNVDEVLNVDGLTARRVHTTSDLKGKPQDDKTSDNGEREVERFELAAHILQLLTTHDHCMMLIFYRLYS